MTDNRQPPKKAENQDPSRGNLGQKQADREEAADEKLDHMGDKDKQPTKSRNEQDK
jgi:hypothetical protein